MINRNDLSAEPVLYYVSGSFRSLLNERFTVKRKHEVTRARKEKLRIVSSTDPDSRWRPRRQRGPTQAYLGTSQ